MEYIDFEKVISGDYKVFVDTSSLLQDNSEYIFFKIIAPLLCLHQKQIIIPKSVYNEIYKHSRSSKIKNINSGIKILTDFAENNLYVVESTFDKQFADNAIISLFSSLRIKYNLCLITRVLPEPVSPLKIRNGICCTLSSSCCSRKLRIAL